MLGISVKLFYRNIIVIMSGIGIVCADLFVIFWHFYEHVCYILYTPIAFNERVTFWIQPPGHCLVCVRLLHCMRVLLRNGYTQA